MSRSWYSFQGGDPTNLANWLCSGSTPTCISGTQLICAIYAPPLCVPGSHPSPFSVRLLDYIGRATTFAEPAFPAAAKKYLYKRPS
jgi:hypothetical protein